MFLDSTASPRDSHHAVRHRHTTLAVHYYLECRTTPSINLKAMGDYSLFKMPVAGIKHNATASM